MTKTFKKGQRVVHFGSWDDKGTVYFRQAIVYSCGKKQMILHCEVKGDEIGRHFDPIAAEGVDFGTRPAMTDEEAEALAMELAAAYIAKEAAAAQMRADKFDQHYRHLHLKRIAELHEPRAKNITGNLCV